MSMDYVQIISFLSLWPWKVIHPKYCSNIAFLCIVCIFCFERFVIIVKVPHLSYYVYICWLEISWMYFVECISKPVAHVISVKDRFTKWPPTNQKMCLHYFQISTVNYLCICSHCSFLSGCFGIWMKVVHIAQLV